MASGVGGRRGPRSPKIRKSLGFNELNIWGISFFSLKRHDSVKTLEKAKSLRDNGRMPIAHGWDRIFFSVKMS